MMKLFIVAAILAVSCASPAPEAKPEAKPAAKPNPQFITAAYTSPLVAAPGVAYTAAYSAPLAYAGYAYAPEYAYPAYSPYTVVV